MEIANFYSKAVELCSGAFRVLWVVCDASCVMCDAVFFHHPDFVPPQKTQ